MKCVWSYSYSCDGEFPSIYCKCCADGHENDDFDTTMPSMLSLPFDSKGYSLIQNV